MPQEEAGGMVIDRERYKYDKVRMVDPKTGKLRVRSGNGDAVAQAMSHLSTTDELAKVVKANKLEGKVAGGIDAFSNAGQYRMNIGNMLRARVKKGETVTIGEHTVKKLDQRIPAPEGVKLAEQRSKEREKEAGKRAAAAEKAAKTNGAKATRKVGGRRSSATNATGDASA